MIFGQSKNGKFSENVITSIRPKVKKQLCTFKSAKVFSGLQVYREGASRTRGYGSIFLHLIAEVVLKAL